MGISGNLWHRFRSCLFNRYQCVSVNDFISSLLPVKSVVPQGSILGPILFILYMNDLPASTQFSNVLMFADDTKRFKYIKSSLDIELLQLDLDSISQWSTNNCLHFNAHSFKA